MKIFGIFILGFHLSLSPTPLQATLFVQVFVSSRLADGDGSEGEILPSLLSPTLR